MLPREAFDHREQQLHHGIMDETDISYLPIMVTRSLAFSANVGGALFSCNCALQKPFPHSASILDNATSEPRLLVYDEILVIS